MDRLSRVIPFLGMDELPELWVVLEELRDVLCVKESLEEFYFFVETNFLQV